jgi:hypothetical protein
MRGEKQLKGGDGSMQYLETEFKITSKGNILLNIESKSCGGVVSPKILGPKNSKELKTIF